MIRFWLFAATALLATVNAALFWAHPAPVTFGCLVFTVLMAAYTGWQAARP